MAKWKKQIAVILTKNEETEIKKSKSIPYNVEKDFWEDRKKPTDNDLIVWGMVNNLQGFLKLLLSVKEVTC